MFYKCVSCNVFSVLDVMSEMPLHELSSLTRSPDEISGLKIELLKQIKAIDRMQCFPKVQ